MAEWSSERAGGGRCRVVYRRCRHGGASTCVQEDRKKAITTINHMLFVGFIPVGE